MYANTLNQLRQYLRRLALLFCGIALLVFFANPGTTGEFPAVTTEANLRTIILEQGGSFTDAELREMDINGDGMVDVADLVMYVSTLMARPSGVNISCAVTNVVEAGEDIKLEITLSSDYEGTIHLAATGTATLQTDFIWFPSKDINVNGSSAEAVLSFPDNSKIEGIKVLTLYVVPDPGYQIGADQQITIYIHDNDSWWRGLLLTGSSVRSFNLKLFRTGSAAEKAVWVSDGSQTIPEGIFKRYPDDIVADDNAFRLESDFFITPASESPLGMEIQRKFIMIYDPGNSDHTLDYSFEIKGDLTEDITVPDGGQIDRTVQGSFVMFKDAQKVGVPQPP